MEPILITDIRKFEDNRGAFYESFKSSVFRERYNLGEQFVQDNHSISSKNTIRGLHYQWDCPMGKLVRVAQGSIVDVLVDIRKGSKTFGDVNYYELSDKNLHQVYVPPGFAHGFSCISDSAVVMYKCTAEYNPNGESGINPFDSFLGVNWGVPRDSALVSDKDISAKSFEEYARNCKF